MTHSLDLFSYLNISRSHSACDAIQFQLVNFCIISADRFFSSSALLFLLVYFRCYCCCCFRIWFNCEIPLQFIYKILTLPLKYTRRVSGLFRHDRALSSLFLTCNCTVFFFSSVVLFVARFFFICYIYFF